MKSYILNVFTYLKTISMKNLRLVYAIHIWFLAYDLYSNFSTTFN